MTPFLVPIFLLCLISSLATAANFNLVYQWNELDYEWPSEASRTQAIENGTYKPQNIKVRFMAVFGTRIFLSLHFSNGIPVTLVSLSTSSASSASPKLTPFPSWDMHGYGDCDKIEEATGLEVDSSGMLWVLDEGSTNTNCTAKLWIFNNNHTELIHRFSFRFYVNDLVLDETRNGTRAYISRRRQRHIVVFSLDRNQSWMVETPGIEVLSIALSPKSKEEPKQLYLSKWNSNELYSISVDALRKGTPTANPKLIGKWTATDSYRMLMDNHGTLHAAFWGKNYINSWNTSQPFEEQRFHEVTVRILYWPFTFGLDQSETLWMTVFDAESVQKLRLFKAAVDDSPK
ncbi:protein yellow-like [Cloeon dipterum]|uniref:protein yellow-like n=1 Tax=Cloeon dipterum TaxID=197152 RepID=UPI00321F83E4